MPYCPHCQSPNPDEAQYCRNCGYLLASTAGGAAPSATATAACPSCRAWVPPTAEFCPSCGHQLAGRVYAGFWIRLLAFIIDWVILFVISVVVQFALGVDNVATASLLQIAVRAVYTIGFWTALGATPGKMALGLRVTMASGEPIGLGPAVLRYIGYFLSGIILLIGYLMIGFTREKRGLHDFIAGTVVIKTR